MATAAMAVAAIAAPAAAANLYVANNGVDGPSCGTKAAPCRSIAQGLGLAVDGDRVSVGPGIYGDNDGNGTLGGVGEEAAIADCGGGDSCLVLVNKAVQVVSEAGAFSTMIRPPAGAVDSVVVVSAMASASFGGKGRGFTVDATVANVAIAAGGENHVVAGNMILASGAQGILFVGGGGVISGNRVICPAGAGTTGIFAFGSPGPALADNAILGCSIGFATFGNAEVSSMVAVGNGLGLGLDDATAADGVLVAGNWFEGITMDSGATGITVSDSSIIGNGDGDANCGIDAMSTASTLAGIWYGAATGPGANPADAVCNAGLLPSPTFSDKPVKVKLKPMR